MNARRIDATVRKLPRQARSIATVDAIVGAAAQVLVTQGYEGTTTARVAERAGVSVGSLYQYFPNKESLVAELIDRHADDVVGTITRVLDDTTHASLRDGISAAIDAVIGAHRIDPRLHKILNQEVPRIGRLGKSMNAEREIARAFERLLCRHADELPAGCDPALAGLVVATVIEAIGHKAVLEPRCGLAGGAAAREALQVVTRYLMLDR
ncbi:TetR/AcrR family transcriptional regulator [Variovorax sp.]|uniref:TetR/AcrR family transcriptional regulator n=1 Tax=Variovorax sp. TaxID=1871043 RepID=UPI002D3ECD88|nr:TetR/AcrR family transcriptional regulator [Variovorax sp.]HYP83551.1 TetR/AcrR family transcriptional regulator [Variovorax sp.]